MLRPATPLSILLFISFVLLLISVISTPIIKGIPLARYQGVNFGVFGWCKDSGQCSNIQVGWNTDQALSGTQDDTFNLLPSSSRHSLSSLLIVHPIAAFCNLVVLGLAIAAHFHSPSHSARYLLALLILLLPTLLVTLLAFLVDILLFNPHLQWGGWIVLASVILITTSGVVTCAMRRTLVSRKARKKRIAENAEMSGANYYANMAAQDKILPAVSTDSRTPMVDGAPGSDALPAFASYSNTRRSEEPRDPHSIPLEPVSAISPIDSDDRYYGAQSRSNSRPRPVADYSTQQSSVDAMGLQHSMPMASSAPIRGSYGPPRGRGNYPPRGTPNFSRGGAMQQRGPPPSAYGNRGGYLPSRGRGGYPPGPPPGAIGAVGGRPPGYGLQGSNPPPGLYGAPDGVAGSMDGRTPGHDATYHQRNSGPPSPSSSYGPEPPTAAYGARAQSPAQRRQSPYGSRTQSPHARQAQMSAGPGMPPVSPTDQYGPERRYNANQYSSALPGGSPIHREPRIPVLPSQPQDGYVPPRAEWMNTAHDAVTRSPQRSQPIVQQRARVSSRTGSDYVEDVDPKFAEQPSVIPSASPGEAFESQRDPIPQILAPGYVSRGPDSDAGSVQIPRPIPQASSYEDLPGARSPVESETSNFTSISQRPMNPNWQPGHGGEFNNLGPRRKPIATSQRHEVLFANNPDFEIPGVGMPGRSGRGGYGPGRGGRMGGGPMRPPPPSVLDGLDGGGRYPGPVSGPGPNMSTVSGPSMREI